MKKVNLYVDEKDYEQLKKIHEETDIPISAMIRRALKTVIEEHKAQKYRGRK